MKWNFFFWMCLFFLCFTNEDVGQIQPRENSRRNQTFEKGYWYSGIASGYYFPTQRFSSSYTFNGGGSYFGGYQITPNTGLQIEWNNWLLSGGGLDTWDLKIVSEILCGLTPPERTSRPTVLCGFGLNYQLNQPGAISYTNFTCPAGLVIQWHLRPRSSIFVESIYYFVFGKTTTRSVPCLLGYSIGF